MSVYTGKCAVCGAKLDGWNWNARYCSPACRQKAYRQRKYPTAGRPKRCECHQCWRAREYHRKQPHRQDPLPRGDAW